MIPAAQAEPQAGAAQPPVAGADERMPRRPMSIDRIFGVLGAIADNPRGRSLTALSQELATPKTSLLYLLPGLTSEGYLTRDGHHYRLGPKAFALARAILGSRQDIAGVARPLLQRLATDSEKTVTFCVLAPDERAILHIVKEESRGGMRFMVDEGHRAPLHTTAGGRVMLAFRPGDWAEHFFTHARLQQNTPNTITDLARLRGSVAEVRRKGYAMTRGETYETVGALAAPVFGPEGFVGAVVAAGAVERVVAQEEKLAMAVRATADDLSALLGGPSKWESTRR